MNKLTRTLATLGASATLALTGVAVIPAVAPLEVAQVSGSIQKADALTVTYYGTLRCVIGVYPVLSYTQWFKHYDYNWYEEQFLKKNDYTVWSHNEYHNRDYYPNSRCNVWGYIIPY